MTPREDSENTKRLEGYLIIGNQVTGDEFHRLDRSRVSRSGERKIVYVLPANPTIHSRATSIYALRIFDEDGAAQDSLSESLDSAVTRITEGFAKAEIPRFQVGFKFNPKNH